MTSKIDYIFPDIVDEYERSVEKHGEQSLPLGSDPVYADYAESWREECEMRRANGTLTWREILMEEIHEAFAETEYHAQRAELVQVANVVMKMIADLDERNVYEEVFRFPVRRGCSE
jgi:hypothetical protein